MMSDDADSPISGGTTRRWLMRHCFASGAAMGGLALAWPLLAPRHAAAQSDLPMEIHYLVRSFGATAAAVRYRLTPDEGGINSSLKIRPKGLLGAVNSTEATLKGRSVWLNDGRLIPYNFHMKVEKSDSTREVAIKYLPDGEIEQLQIKRNGTERASKVDTELRTQTLDPLTAIAMIRHGVQQNPNESEEPANLRVFDGRKRYDIDWSLARIDEDDNNPFDGAAHRITALRTPIAGYDDDDDDWLRHLRGETKPLDMFVTADDRLLPYRAEAEIGPISGSVELEEYCIDGRCRKT